MAAGGLRKVEARVAAAAAGRGPAAVKPQQAAPGLWVWVERSGTVAKVAVAGWQVMGAMNGFL